MKALRRIVTQASPQSHLLLLYALRFSCAAAFAAFLLLLHTPLTLYTLRTIRQLYLMPKGLLLLGVILCPILEERSRLG